MKKRFKDQMNRWVEINFPPKKIISLVPSQSELLWDLDLQNNLIGITKFCIHPNEMFHTIERIGGTKKINIERVIELKPDLIIGNKEENTKEDIEELEKHFPIWMSDVNNFEQALEMISSLSEITNTETQGQTLITSILNSFSKVPMANKSVVYLIWKNPFMGVGKNTYIDALLSKIGYSNLIIDNRYPELEIENLKKIKPNFIFLSTEPYPFKEEDIEYLQKEIPESKIILVDGEMFTWYGSRMLMAADYFKNLITSFLK